jgi:hypothetical protein
MSTPSLAFNDLRTFAATLEAAGATHLQRHWPVEMPFSKFKAYLLKLAEHARVVYQVVMLGTLLEVGAVALCMGNPAYASEVGLACSPVWVLFGVASHCGLFIFTNREIRAQYSLGLFGTTFNTDPLIMQADRAAFFNGDVYTIKAPQGETQEEFERSIVDFAERYRAPYYDLVIGPNSNSAAAYPLVMSGAELPNVQRGLLGAWGLGYWSSGKAAAGPAFGAAAPSRQRHSRHKA